MPKSYFLVFILPFLFFLNAHAQTSATVSGIVKDKKSKTFLPFVNVVLKKAKDSSFVGGTVTNEEGRFNLSKVNAGTYILEFAYIGYASKSQSLFVGKINEYLDLQTIEIEENSTALQEVIVTQNATQISEKMDKKTFSLKDNLSQSGGSVLQVMQNLPSVTVQDGKVQLRGSDKITVLIDGKQTALTGFGSQTGLDNIPASAIEKIEIINNPSAKYDANGNAGIINIIYKKNKSEGFNGKVGFTTGVGSLWVREDNLPTIRPQYTFTQKSIQALHLITARTKSIFFSKEIIYTPRP